MSIAILHSPMSSHFELKKDHQYVHPLTSHTCTQMSQNSLEICTESLGSETGSDGFSDDLQFYGHDTVSVAKNTQEPLTKDVEMDTDDDDVKPTRERDLRSVNYHCSVGRRYSSSPRSFPPPLPSLSRRDGPCLHMRPRRSNGRLVVEAVPVPSLNYLHAQRENGRLLLSFVDTSVASEQTRVLVQENGGVDVKREYISTEVSADTETSAEEVEVETETEEEEVEVVDRGTVVEVKVSTQPQQQGGTATGAKVHRSMLVINKFVGGTPNPVFESVEDSEPPVARRAITTTTAANAVVVASALSFTTGASSYVTRTLTLCGEESGHSQWPPLDNKLLFTSKQRNREELVHNMLRCNELRRPLFIYEPCCIASS